MTIPTPPTRSIGKPGQPPAAAGRNAHRDRGDSHEGDRGTGGAHAG
jgi:hypothetical protein